jgi:hypothetical protein
LTEKLVLTTFSISGISLVTPGRGFAPGVVGIDTINSLGLPLPDAASIKARCLAYASALIVGVYEEITRLNVFSVDPGE